MSTYIVLKLGPTRLVDSGLEPGRVDEKIEKVMTRLQPVDFCFVFFLLKQRRLNFF
jgi:hypothetical protein